VNLDAETPRRRQDYRDTPIYPILLTIGTLG